jgi:hypothetical protein
LYLLKPGLKLNFFDRRKILKGSNFLELTPVKIRKEKFEENGLVSILVEKFENKFVRNFMLSRRRSPEIKIKLDEFGSEAWKLIDGSRKVEQIAKQLVEKYGEKISPVDERLGRFYTQLYEQRLISFKEIQ